jgi:hypothetical protein
MKILLATLLLAGACADPHMGDLYGRRTRSAFDAQRDARTEGVSLDAVDGKAVSTRYHSTPTQGGQQQSGASISIPIAPMSSSQQGYSGSSSGVQASGPPAGGIRLVAVK